MRRKIEKKKNYIIEKIKHRVQNNPCKIDIILGASAGLIWGTAISLEYMTLDLSYNLETVLYPALPLTLTYTAVGAGVGFCCCKYQVYKHKQQNTEKEEEMDK